ncbi:DNA repair protein RadC [Lactobacillus hamsteri]|uniref:DNA repair protein RadC n=1 Tax=Lactobacillus hamsteri DSM 5661 = JCM 6256 TaxID=1423754 RepID=A0A0R1Y4G5_9LACO|nr:DNA repair protein RadC [Lactobacillus hamsteri]KRM37232.1 DNA repair protein RadC [Lactobacillus hamsteri DSM 5661 = JCM 6256]
MKFYKSHHYEVHTDMELLIQLFDQLEDNGVHQFFELKNKLRELKINSFEDLLTYASGPNSVDEMAITIEELVDRIRLSESKRDAILTSSKEVGSYLSDKLIGRKQEEFWALYLDNGNKIIAEKKISQGTLDRSIAHPRDIFRWAVVYNCSAIIVAHNHPSGKLIPSHSDFKMTKQLQEAANMMKIDFLDHFIVGKGHYLSMKENELF